MASIESGRSSDVVQIKDVGLVTTAPETRVSRRFVSRLRNEKFRGRLGAGISAVGLVAQGLSQEANNVSPVLGAIVDGIKIVSLIPAGATLFENALRLDNFLDRQDQKKKKNTHPNQEV